MPDSATRLVSLHDPEARPIRKGRIDHPVKFGYKAQVTDDDDGIALDCSVEHGARTVRSAPAVERITGAGRVPSAVTADRGYGLPSAERDLHDLGVGDAGGRGTHHLHQPDWHLEHIRRA